MKFISAIEAHRAASIEKKKVARQQWEETNKAKAERLIYMAKRDTELDWFLSEWDEEIRKATLNRKESVTINLERFDGAGHGGRERLAEQLTLELSSKGFNVLVEELERKITAGESGSDSDFGTGYHPWKAHTEYWFRFTISW
jgi:hypothetical protein